MERTRTTTGVLRSITEQQTVVQGPKYSACPAVKPTVRAPISVDCTRTSTIIDDDDGFGKFNTCRHYTEEVYRSDTPIQYSVYDDVTGQLAFTVKGNYRAGMNPSTLAPIVTYFPSDITKWTVPDHSGEAVRAMWPEIESRLSLINSIVELKDFKRLNPTIERTIDFLYGGMSVFRNIRSAKTLKQVVTSPALREKFAGLRRTAAELFLTDQFAIRPFLSDCSDAMSAYQSVRNDVNRLLRNEGQILRSHYRRTLSAKDLGLTKDLPYYAYSGPWTEFYYDRCYTVEHTNANGQPPVYCATMLYKYWLSDFDRRNAVVLGGLDSLGVNINPAIVWNAIPWSFVVDWVLKVQDWIDQFKIRALEPTVIIRQFCHSVKFQPETNVWIYPYQYWAEQQGGKIGSYSFTTVPKLKACSFKRSYYMRTPHVPRLIASLSDSPISPREIALALGLAQVSTRGDV